MALNPFIRFIDFLAKMGLILRGDPPRSIDMAGRQWGEPVHGIALSIREIKRDDPEQRASISAVLKNTGTNSLPLTIPGWVNFYKMEVDAPFTAYGRALTAPGRHADNIEITLGPGDATETDLPVGSVYEMRGPKDFKVRVSCRLPDGAVLQSNEVVIRT